MDKNNKLKVKKALFWLAVTLMFTVGILCFAASRMLADIDRGDGTFDDTKLDTHAGLSDEVINIAVFGVDSRTNDVSGRSDAIMIVSVDMKHDKIKAVSLMRDSLVEIENYGWYKLNGAYARGGVELAIKTINQNFKMNITDYVSLNFNQLAGIVDALGGVEVEITEAERKNANKYIKEMAYEVGEDPDLIKEAGTVTLYGYQAVAYARIRYVGNADFQRTERQREVMEKLMNKALDTNPIRYPALIKSLIPMVETSLSNEEILRIAGSVLLSGKPRFEQGRFPLDGTYKSNSSYAMVYDLDEAADKLHRFIYEDEPFYEEKTKNLEE
ncbi:MAG: LCP family protein [Oscillospiraceae bacterium]|nr:LCP family protein [Oscillospiraceae bacterium]